MNKNRRIYLLPPTVMRGCGRGGAIAAAGAAGGGVVESRCWGGGSPPPWSMLSSLELNEGEAAAEGKIQERQERKRRRGRVSSRQ